MALGKTRFAVPFSKAPQKTLVRTILPLRCELMQDDLLKLLSGRRGHFRMESGYHSELWFELDRLFAQPERLQPFVVELAARLARCTPDAVCGPMSGGAKLAELIAAEIGVDCLNAVRHQPANSDGLFQIKYELPIDQREKVRGKRVAIVDDAICAGSAVRGTHEDLVRCGAQPVALGALFVFGHAIQSFAGEHNLALECVAALAFGMWKPEACPLCRGGVALEPVSDAGGGLSSRTHG